MTHLELRQVSPLQELDKAWNHALADDLLDGRVALCRSPNTRLVSLQPGRLVRKQAHMLAGSDSPIERSLRNCEVASNWAFGSSLHTPCTMAGRLSSYDSTSTFGFHCCSHKEGTAHCGACRQQEDRTLCTFCCIAAPPLRVESSMAELS